MRIRTKLLLSTFLPLGIAAAIGIFVLFSVHNLNKMAKKDMIIGRTLKEISQLNIVTNDYLLHYSKRAQRQWQLQQDTLTRLLAKVELKGQKAQIVLDFIRRDNEAAKALFDQLTTNYENRAHLNKEQIGVSLELEKRLAGQLMARSQAMASNTSQLGQIAQAGMLNTRKMATMLVLASVVILAAVIGTTAFFTTKTVVKPISRLHKGAEVVGAGNLDYRVGTTAGDEIGQLSRAFDRMSQQLKVTVVLRDELAEEVARRTVEVRKAYDELDEKVVERTAELAEANVR
ncbi:MAG: HAMP domain-containing protein, partial [Desulfatiglandales bacterium]